MKLFCDLLSSIQCSPLDEMVATQDESVGELQLFLHTDNMPEHIRYERTKSFTNVNDKKHKMTNVPSNSCTAIMIRLPGGALSLNPFPECSISNENQQLCSHYESDCTEEKCHR